LEAVLATHGGCVRVVVEVFGELDFGGNGGLVASADKVVVKVEMESITGELGGGESTEEVEGLRGEAVLYTDGGEDGSVSLMTGETGKSCEKFMVVKVLGRGSSARIDARYQDKVASIKSRATESTAVPE